MKAGEGKQSGKQGLKKTEKTQKLCKLIIEELKIGEKSSYELEKKFGIKEALFPSILLQLTYLVPIYEYKKGGKLYLGLIK